MLTKPLANSSVVLYHPKLTRIFACHLIVELCITLVEGTKYVFNYIFKRHDLVKTERIGDAGNDGTMSQEGQEAGGTRAGTKLTLWFEANIKHAEARHFRSVDFL